MGFNNRDYSEEFEITLSWSDWDKVWCLMAQGIDKKEADEWPNEELERDRELRKTLATKIGEASPGNGMDDWPDSMKRAYDETVMEMIRDE